MLVRLTSEQVSLYWPAIEDGLNKTIPDHPAQTTIEKTNKILAMILSGNMDAWIEYDKQGEEKVILNGSLITKIEIDRIYGLRSCLIISAYMHNKMDKVKLKNAWFTIEKFARGKDCKMLACYTNVPVFVQVARGAGAEIMYRYISINL